MDQLTLFDLPPHSGPPGLPQMDTRSTAEIEQDRIDQHRLQGKLPHLLRYDAWQLWRDPDGYRIFHPFTGLETDAHQRPQPAIDEAIRIAAFFELLPLSELLRIDRESPEYFTRLPVRLAVRYRRDAKMRPRQWLAAFDRRHAGELKS